jgi:hypothetical protein
VISSLTIQFINRFARVDGLCLGEMTSLAFALAPSLLRMPKENFVIYIFDLIIYIYIYIYIYISYLLFIDKSIQINMKLGGQGDKEP